MPPTSHLLTSALLVFAAYQITAKVFSPFGSPLRPVRRSGQTSHHPPTDSAGEASPGDHPGLVLPARFPVSLVASLAVVAPSHVVLHNQPMQQTAHSRRSWLPPPLFAAVDLARSRHSLKLSTNFCTFRISTSADSRFGQRMKIPQFSASFAIVPIAWPSFSGRMRMPAAPVSSRVNAIPTSPSPSGTVMKAGREPRDGAGGSRCPAVWSVIGSPLLIFGVRPFSETPLAAQGAQSFLLVLFP